MSKQLLKKIWYGKIGQTFLVVVSRFIKFTGIYPGATAEKYLTIPDQFKVRITIDDYFIMHNTGLWIEKALYWKGIKGYEDVTLRIFIQLMDKCDWMIDVGANSGLFALTANTIKPTAKVYAFEPMPYFFDLLSRNIQLNQLNIVSIKSAVSDIEGKLTFYMPEKGMGNLYSSTLKIGHYNIHQDSKPKTIDVDCIRLDTFFKHHTIVGQGILKIDAEGNDYEVIKSMGSYLEKYKPFLLVENEDDVTAEKIKMLPGMEIYRFLSLPEGDATRPAWLSSPVFKGGRNILFVPAIQTDYVWALTHQVLGSKDKG